MSTAGATVLPPAWAISQRRALLVGAGGAALSIVMALIQPSSFFQGYLVGFLFWLGIALGSLGILMLHFLVGGAWGFLIRRPLEASALTILLIAVLFLPIALGLKHLYPWADAVRVQTDEVLQHKRAYLNVTWFLIRAVVVLGSWSGLALLLNRNARAQDNGVSTAPTRLSEAISGPGLVFLFLSTTIATIDWLMSLEPDWYSTIYSAMLIVGMALSAFSAMIIVAALLADVDPLSEVAGAEAFNDLGNLLLAFVMLWAYMSFSQFLIVWSGNLTEEIPWYLRRSAGGWWWICLALILFHFFMPFGCLLFRETKRNPRNLWKVAVVILTMQVIDCIWLVVPAFGTVTIGVAVSLVAALVGIGGLWTWAFIGLLKRRPLLPRNDPLLAQVLEHAHAGGH
jgi:hypothetical protein